MANRFIELASSWLPESVTARLDRRDPKHQGTQITPQTEVLDRRTEQTVKRFLTGVTDAAAVEIKALMGADSSYWIDHEGATAAAVIEAVSRATERGRLNHVIVGITKSYISEQVAIQLRLLQTRQRWAGEGSIHAALSANQHLIGADDVQEGLISVNQIAEADSAYVGHDRNIVTQNEAALERRALNLYLEYVFLGGQKVRGIEKLDTPAAKLFMAQMLRRAFERELWKGTIDEKVALAQVQLLQAKGVNPDNFLDSPGSYGMMTVFLADPFHRFQTESLGKTQLAMMKTTRSIAELAYNRAIALQLFPNDKPELQQALVSTLKFYLDNGAFRASTEAEAEAVRGHIASVEQHISTVMLGTAGKLIDYAVATADQVRQPLALAKQVEKYKPQEVRAVTNIWADGVARHIVTGQGTPQLVVLSPQNP